MKIWSYHPATHELVGVGTADSNPLEPGEWLLPAYSTQVEPPSPEEGKTPIFDGQSWRLVADHRGEKWWPKDAADNTKPPVIVDYFGDPAERGLTSVEPPAPPAPPTVVSASQIRRALLRAGLRAAFEDHVAQVDQEVRDLWQFEPSFSRNGVVKDVLEALRVTPVDIDALFDLAKTL